MNPIVKICGITRIEDALFAQELGASAIGFVMYPKSPRYIAPDDAARISDRLKPYIVRVGVFVDEAPGVVMDAVGKAGLTAVQLHGSEDAAYIRGLGNIRVIKAFRVGSDFDESMLDGMNAGAFLLDAWSPDMHGGTGATFDWSIAVALARKHRIMLAGGLRPSNIRSAVETVRPWGVDVSSGVESDPGVKDHEKMRALFHALEGIE